MNLALYYTIYKLILQLNHGSMAPNPDPQQISNVSGSSEKQTTSKSCVLCEYADKRMSKYKNWGPAERKFCQLTFLWRQLSLRIASYVSLI